MRERIRAWLHYLWLEMGNRACECGDHDVCPNPRWCQCRQYGDDCECGGKGGGCYIDKFTRKGAS